MTTEKYYCKSCDYITELSSNFKRHIISDKHIKNNVDCIIVDIEKCKIKLYLCKNCGKEFNNKSTKSRHQKICNFSSNCNKNEIDVLKEELKLMQLQNIQIQTQMQNQIYAQMQARIDSLEAQSNSMRNITQSSISAMEKSAESNIVTANVANKSMNILKYVQTNFPDAPPLRKLNKEEAFSMLCYDKINMTEEENEKYVRLVIANYENKNIARFFGDLIVNYYREDDVKDVKFWTADVARLCFCVMQTVDKDGKTEWMKDKSGEKFTEMVIKPMFCALKLIFNEFLMFKKEWEETCKNPTFSQMDFVLNARQKCMELLKDIRYNKFTQPILKVVAPKYDFDTYQKAIEEKSKQEKVKVNGKIKSVFSNEIPIKNQLKKRND